MRASVAVILLSALGLLLFVIDLRLQTTNLLTWIQANPSSGFFVFVVGYAIATGSKTPSHLQRLLGRYPTASNLEIAFCGQLLVFDVCLELWAAVSSPQHDRSPGGCRSGWDPRLASALHCQQQWMAALEQWWGLTTAHFCACSAASAGAGAVAGGRRGVRPAAWAGCRVGRRHARRDPSFSTRQVPRAHLMQQVLLVIDVRL